MSKIIYLITHGWYNTGANPRMTDMGVKQVEAAKLPVRISMLVCGTGARHVQTLEAVIGRLSPDIQVPPIKFWPLCGSADVPNMERSAMVLAGGGDLIQMSDYLAYEFIRPWELLANLPANTLLIGGEELLLGIGANRSYIKKAGLYELDVTAANVKLIW